jgi:hypothetical protein
VPYDRAIGTGPSPRLPPQDPLTQEPPIDHKTLRELFRHLQAFQSLFETEGIDTITGPDGVAYNLFDLLKLYQCRQYLSSRQRQAIELFLFCDMREKDVAAEMGVSPVNPVAIYATQGLKRLVVIYNSGFINPGGDGGSEEAKRHDAAPVRSLPRAGRCSDGADKAVA